MFATALPCVSAGLFPKEALNPRDSFGHICKSMKAPKMEKILLFS